MIEKIKNNKFLIISLFIVYIGIFLICKYNMFAQDEYNYSHIAWTDTKLETIGDIITSQISIYKNWSGRIPVLATVQFFLCFGKYIYDLINPLMFILFIIMILKVSDNKITSRGVFSVVFLTVFGAYKFWEKYIWLSGSLNYLWPVCLMLIVIYYIYNMIINDKKLNVLNTIILFITSFFAGWSHENVAFVLGSTIIFMAIFNLKKILKLEKSTKIKLILSVLLFGIGAILLIFCPGNFGRLNTTQRTVSLLPILKNIAAMYMIIIIYIITVIILKKSKRINENNNVKEILKEQVKYFIFPAIFALLPMIIIAEFPIRASLAYEVMIFIVILKNLKLICAEYNEEKIVKISSVVVVSIAMLVLYSKSLFSLCCLKPYSEKIESQIEYQKNNNQRDIVVSKFNYEKFAKYFIQVYMDIFPKNLDTSIINNYMSVYYDVDSITAVEDGYVQIEIDISNEDEIVPYNVIDRETKEIIAERVILGELLMPNTSLNGRLIFNIPIEKLDNAYLELNDSVKQNIINIEYRSLDNIEKSKVYNVIE